MQEGGQKRDLEKEMRMAGFKCNWMKMEDETQNRARWR